MIIREARLDELDAVSSLLAAAWDEYRVPPGASPARREGFARYKASVADVWSRWQDSILLVAERAGALVGAVTYYPPVLEQGPDDWPVGYAGIRLLGVHPDVRGNGVGRALTEECLLRAHADGATHVGLHSTIMMSVAKAMYERMGFVPLPAYDIPVDDGFVVEAFELKLA